MMFMKFTIVHWNYVGIFYIELYPIGPAIKKLKATAPTFTKLMPVRQLFVQKIPPEFNENPTFRLVANPMLRTSVFFVLCKEGLILVVLNLRVEGPFLHSKHSRILISVSISSHRIHHGNDNRYNTENQVLAAEPILVANPRKFARTLKQTHPGGRGFARNTGCKPLVYVCIEIQWPWKPSFDLITNQAVS
jgi:hypothetical protein